MTQKPTTASGYQPGTLEAVQQTLLLLATILGDLLDDIVVVGGLVPSLLISKDELPAGADAHIGTNDLDLGLALTLLEQERYREISKRLRDRGFQPNLNDKGNKTHQRWRFDSDDVNVTLDFLIPPMDGTAAGAIKHIDDDFGAIVTPGLELAIEHHVIVAFQGKMPAGATAQRDIRVCGVGPFIVLKSLAMDGRSAPKDAYDIFYVLENFPGGVDVIAAKLLDLRQSRYFSQTRRILGRDFKAPKEVGPHNVATFLTGGSDAAIQARVYAYVSDLLAILDEDPG